MDNLTQNRMVFPRNSRLAGIFVFMITSENYYWGRTGVWIPLNVMSKKELSVIEKVLLSEILYFDVRDDGCRVSNESFASFLGTSETSVKRHLTHLKRLGLIYVKNFDGRERVLGVKTL